MASMLRWGILGTAHIARALIRGIGLSTDSCVQAVASRELTRANEWAKECGVPRAFGSYHDLLCSGEVDAIYNPLPNSMHAEWTIKALELGLPVLCEKPLTANAQEAREVVRVAKAQNVLVGEAFMYRHHPVYERVAELIAQDAIGDLVSIRSEFAFSLDEPDSISAKPELAGGSLMDVGCYCVNLSRLFADCEPTRVTAMERRGAVDNTMLGCLEFPTGLLAHFECSFETRERTRAEFVGTRGEIVLRNPWFPGEEYGEVLLRRDNKTEGIATPGGNCYHLEVDDFVRACRTREPLRWPAEDAIKNMAVIDALRTSAKEGRTVPVEA